MSDDSIVAVILAAGKGTRMHSPKPKVLMEMLGDPMLSFVYKALEPLFGDRTITVIGHGADQVRAAFPEREESFVVQEQQLGTGHALQVAWDAVRKSGSEYCLVINGDTPLAGPGSIGSFVSNGLIKEGGADLSFMTIAPKDPAQFGRVIRDNFGKVTAIVEAKDFDQEKHGKPVREVNAGIYLFKVKTIEPLLEKLTNENAGGEYYITDLVDLAFKNGLMVNGVACGDDKNLMGINSPMELASAEFAIRKRLVNMALSKGVIMHAPESITLGMDVIIEPGAELYGPCEIYGKSRVEAGATVSSHVWMRDSEIKAGAMIRQFSHIEGAEVGPDCIVGPYARLRPEAIMREGARVGNFVEMKKAELGPGAKASHLTYLGDAEIGAGTNIGAGTITCNYDGKNKFKTTIGEKVFIGSNTALVAPVTVADGALVGAGSTITKNVSEGDLAIARSKQRNISRRKNSS